MSFISAGILEDTFSWPGLNIRRQNVSLSGVSGSNWHSSEMTCGVSRTCYTQCHAKTQRSECELTYHRPQWALAVTAAPCCCKSCTLQHQIRCTFSGAISTLSTIQLVHITCFFLLVCVIILHCNAIFTSQLLNKFIHNRQGIAELSDLPLRIFQYSVPFFTV